MKVYLAGYKTIEKVWNKSTEDIYLLSSFWEHKSGKYGDYVKQEKHILDSGAYSALAGTTGKEVDWNLYVKKYIKFIINTKQKLFFEMDIDPLVGLPKVLEYREQIEEETGIKSIPVWHKSRGKQNWLNLVKKYNYVAIGGIVTKEIKKKEYPLLRWFLDEAKKENCKVHGLGFTSVPMLKKLKFYSVDSTTWNVGGRFGKVCIFEDNKYSKQWKPDNKRVKNIKTLNLYNFQTWVKFQKYAETNL